LKTNELCDELSLDHLAINDFKKYTTSSSTETFKLDTIAKEQADLLKRLENLNLQVSKLSSGQENVDSLTKGIESLNLNSVQQRQKLNVDLSQFKGVNRVTSRQNVN
jgi:hypothetical protein